MEQPTALLLPNGPTWDSVSFTRILYIEADNKYCRIITAEHKYQIRRSMGFLLAVLPPMQFLRIHRRFTVRVDVVESVGKAELLVAGRILPLARNARPALYEKLKKT